jgi:hypothetical protein
VVVFPSIIGILGHQEPGHRGKLKYRNIRIIRQLKVDEVGDQYYQYAIFCISWSQLEGYLSYAATLLSYTALSWATLYSTDLKVHKHDIFLTFFAETENIWSQVPVTRDFWKSLSIRPRYSTFKHFRACSACDEIGSAYQHAMKFVPHMFSVRWNWFRVCSACHKIVSAYAQHTHAIIFEKYSKTPN